MLSQNKKDGLNRIILCGVVCVILFLIAVYWNYIKIAGSTVPIMDFWHWIAVYGQKIEDGSIRFIDFFFSDSGEHVQPLAMSIQFSVLKASDFDVWPLVKWGAVFRIVIAILLAASFVLVQKKDASNSIFKGITAICLVLCVLNFNQWEMTTEPFSLGNSLRVFLYFLSFCVPALWEGKICKLSRGKRGIVALLFGCWCASVTILFSAAYFVGLLPAIGFSFLYLMMRNKSNYKDYLPSVLIWGVLSFIGALVYLWMFLYGNRSSVVGSVSLLKLPFLLVESVVLFWGASILPNRLSEVVGLAPFYIIGTLLLVYIVVLLIGYFGNDKKKYGLFPLTCIVYSLLIAIVIGIGRIGEFSSSVMCSSRYVIESSIGLVGITILTYERYLNHFGNIKLTLKGVILQVVLLITLCGSMVSELQIAPYRGLYNENIAEMMMNIDAYSDEELSVTQGQASDVRYCVQFFKDNNLSIFK